ncbi:MAG TPA: response regulator transcription factor [Planctomycetota bacterium]|nr:response regulator transcription factor [Planctomycetota bacterium]
MPQKAILVIEDDAPIRRGIVDALKYAGYAALEAADGTSGLETAVQAAVDMVLLDVVMPGLDGFAVLTELRKAKPAVPVIMLTARGSEGDRVRGLKSGADDYVVKPFSAKELLARVEAVFRRSAERPQDVTVLELAGRSIHFERREVRFADGRRCELSDREAELIRYLAANPGRAVSRDELLARVWGLSGSIYTRTIDMTVARIREKLGDNAESPCILLTVRTKGYMLNV